MLLSKDRVKNTDYAYNTQTEDQIDIPNEELNTDGSQNDTPLPTYQNNNVFSNDILSFSYSAKLSVRDNMNIYQITIMHSIPYEHQNPCDFKGDGAPYKDLTDFNVGMTVQNMSLIDTIKLVIPGLSEYSSGNSLTLSPGFIDAYSLNGKSGYKITQGVEGCGLYTYFIPISSTKTLVVTRGFITEFSGAVESNPQIEHLEGVIKPSEEEAMFAHIMSSVVVK